MTPFFITLHLDPNGGSITEGTVDIKAGGSYGLLPSAYREGYIFAGWFTDPEGGDQIISSDMPVSEEEHTLYAHWIKKKADKKSKYSRNKAHKKTIVILAVMTVILSIVWAVVNHIISIIKRTNKLCGRIIHKIGVSKCDSRMSERILWHSL